MFPLSISSFKGGWYGKRWTSLHSQVSAWKARIRSGHSWTTCDPLNGQKLQSVLLKLSDRQLIVRNWSSRLSYFLNQDFVSPQRVHCHKMPFGQGEPCGLSSLSKSCRFWWVAAFHRFYRGICPSIFLLLLKRDTEGHRKVCSVWGWRLGSNSCAARYLVVRDTKWYFFSLGFSLYICEVTDKPRSACLHGPLLCSLSDVWSRRVWVVQVVVLGRRAAYLWLFLLRSRLE